MKKLITIFGIVLLLTFSAFSQWSTDPNVNSVVCDLGGSQAVPHIAYDASGNFYVGFYSNNSGNYDIRLQYYNYDGVAQWTDNGILISDNAQNSWITDWDLTTDNSGNCVMAFNDIRDGNPDVFAYSIAPDGSFNWGSDGITLTNSPLEEYVPSISVTSSNDIIVVWSRPTSPYAEMVMQKITQEGVLSWGASGITYQAGFYSYTGPRVLGVENGNYLIAFYKETGSFPALNRSIYIQKFDSDGNAVWTNDVLVSDDNQINNFNNFYIAPDNANGIIISWMDDRDNDDNIDGIVQRVNGDGTIDWPANGVEVNTTNSTSNQTVRILGVDNNDNVFVTWSKKTSDQNQTSIAGQKFNSVGERQWTDNGITFVPMSSNVAYANGGVLFNGSDAMIFYEEYAGSTAYSHIKAFAVDSDGSFLWSPTSTLVASRSTSKVHTVVSDIYNSQVITTWEEDGNDIYMQNIFTDGSLGVPPISNDATLSDLAVNDVTVDGFSSDIYNYSVVIPAGDPLPITDATANNSFATVEITQATSVPGTSTVLVTAEDGVTQLSYTIDFRNAGTDATLSDLTVDDISIDGFSPEILFYDYDVYEGDPIPVIDGIANDSFATIEVTQTTELPGDSYILVTAEDGTTQMTYQVHFNLITNISEINTDDIKVYPNPADNELNIGGIAAKVKISIISILGEEIMSMEINKESTIDVSSLKKGVYFLRIIDSENNNTSSVLRFIKR